MPRTQHGDRFSRARLCASLDKIFKSFSTQEVQLDPKAWCTSRQLIPRKSSRPPKRSCLEMPRMAALHVLIRIGRVFIFFGAFRTWNRAQEGFLITFRVTGCNCVLLGTVPYRESCRCLCLLSLFPWRVCVYLLIAVECDCFCFVTFFWLGDGQQGDDKPPGPRHHPICGAEVPGRASVIRGAIAAWFVSRGLLVT